MSSSPPISLSVAAITKRRTSFQVKTCHIQSGAQRTAGAVGWQLANKLGRAGRRKWGGRYSRRRRLQHNNNSCDKKGLSGGSAACLIGKFCSLPRRARCDVDRRWWQKKVLKSPKRSGREAGEAPTSSVPLGYEATGTIGERVCDRAPWALPWLPLSRSAICRATEGVFPGLEGGRAGCLQSYKPLPRLHSFTLTQHAREGNLLERHWATWQSASFSVKFWLRNNFLS